eukprot:CFRG1874T1
MGVLAISARTQRRFILTFVLVILFVSFSNVWEGTLVYNSHSHKQKVGGNLDGISSHEDTTNKFDGKTIRQKSAYNNLSSSYEHNESAANKLKRKEAKKTFQTMVAAEANMKAPTAVVVRIIANDFRSTKETIQHVKLILEQEGQANFPGVIETRWILNRLHDVNEMAAIVALLTKHRAVYSIIPFELDVYKSKALNYEGRDPVDILRSARYYEMSLAERMSINHHIYRYRKNYMINLQGGRAFALRQINYMNPKPDWALLLDWDVVLLPVQWTMLRRNLREFEGRQYIRQINIPTAVVHYTNLTSYSQIMPEQYQIGNQQSAIKISSRHENDKWEDSSNSRDRTLASLLLFQVYMDTKPYRNSKTYLTNVFTQLKSLDGRVAKNFYGFTDQTLLMYNETVLKAEKKRYQQMKNNKLLQSGTDKELDTLIDGLVNRAEYALSQGPWSVTDKTEQPPSRNKHDYYSVKPYYWPNPDTPDGLPYVRRDGKRIPGSILYDEGSEKYDRTALANMFRNTTTLALAFYFTEDEMYARKATENIRVWFLNEDTRQTPHCMYAQIQWGVNGNLGRSTGVLEFRNFFFFLDVVRLLESAKSFTDKDSALLKEWMSDYSKYLDTSKQAKTEYKHNNNHGTYFDVQRLAISAYLNELDEFVWLAQSNVGRILDQFVHDGTMPHEMIRPTQLHYMMFSLQGWLIIAHMVKRAGVDLWSYVEPGETEPALLRSCTYTIPCFNSTWSHYQSDTENMSRMIPLAYQALEGYPELKERQGTPEFCKLPSLYNANPEYSELDGPHMFWNLGLSDMYS